MKLSAVTNRTLEVKEGKMMEFESEPQADLDALKKELMEERVKSKELLDRLKYAQADLENYRKRAEKELAGARDSSVKGLVVRLLVVSDELALAVRHAEEEDSDGALAEGFRMIQRNLEGALEAVGVEKIEAMGKPFNPALHEAVEKVQGRGDGRQVVLEEMRAGYTMNGQVLRPSMVRVGPAPDEPKEETQ